MKTIKLTKGLYAKVDDEDFERLNKYKWCAARNSSKSNIYYAITAVKKDGKYKNVKMHRLLLNPPEGDVCDHINGDGLDNRKINLRSASNQQNAANRKQLGNNNTSGFKGVFWEKGRYWAARIQVKGKNIRLGFFKTKEEAAMAYNEGAKKYYGNFARLNNI